MDHPFIRKLACFAALSDEDRVVLANTLVDRRDYAAGEVIALCGSVPKHFFAAETGIAYRYISLDAERTQILGFAIPGDACDLWHFDEERLGYSAKALTDCTLLIMSRAHLELVARRPNIALALKRSALTDRAVLMQRLVSLGCRGAVERIAHFLCEIRVRMAAVGLVTGASFSLPLSQTQLAKAMGLSVVHANRAMQRLRDEGLIEFHDGLIELRDLAGLERAGSFTADHLPYLVQCNPGPDVPTTGRHFA